MAPRSDVLERPGSGISALGVIAPPPIYVQSPTFDGSLATLFKCVRDHQVDLLGVPLFPICEAYFEYLIRQEGPDLDEAAAALSALAYLLERKAWLLLPAPEVEPDYEESMELPEPTTHEFATAIFALQVWQEQRDHLFFRSPDMGPNPYELPYTLKNITVADLARALERVLQRAEPVTVQPLGRPRKSIQDQMRVVLLTLSLEWRTLDALIPIPFTREEAVYWFLSLLELIRLGQAGARLEGDDVVFARV